MGRKSYVIKGLISAEMLNQFYVVESLSVQSVADRLSVSTGTVHKYLKLYDIPRRNRGSRRSRTGAPIVPPVTTMVDGVINKGDSKDG